LVADRRRHNERDVPGNWYDPSRSGQGLVIEINNVSLVAFFA
jgi:hypothetical protein